MFQCEKCLRYEDETGLMVHWQEYYDGALDFWPDENVEALCRGCYESTLPEIMDTEKTIVIFRAWKTETASVIALFPELPADYHNKYCTSYQHAGQHGAADYDFVIEQTRSATESEYKDLFDELTKIGYNLVVRKRRNGRKL